MLKLNEILRASHVQRWNIVATCREQSVAEHSFNVCMIARALCKWIDMDDEILIKAALEHDLDEIVFGDIPSPMKAKLHKDGIDINTYVGNKMRDLTYLEGWILKVADLLDAILFLRDNAIGSHAKDVCKEVKERLTLHLNTCSMCSVDTKLKVKAFADEVLYERI